MTKQRKARRKLSDITFEKEGAHVALVSKDQGGPANGHDYALVLKANNFSQEFVEKMQQIRVTMELPEFLRKFFGMYHEDADVLAQMLGYQPEPTDTVEAMPMASYQDYIESRLEAFEVLKSASDAESLADVLSKLNEDEYLAMLNDQVTLEQAFENLEKAYKPKVGDMVQWNSSGGKAKGKIEHIMTEGVLGVPGTEFSLTGSSENPAVLIRIYRDGEPTETMVGHKSSTLTKIKKSNESDESIPSNEVSDESDTSTNASVEKSVEPSGSETQELEKSVMTQEVQTNEAPAVEMVEKAALVDIQKSLAETQELLKAAQATIAQFEADKKEAIAKAKTEQVRAIVKDETKVVAIAKAALSLESEDDFTAFLAAIQAMMATVETSEMFVEKGATSQEEQPVVQESAVAKLLKAKQATK